MNLITSSDNAMYKELKRVMEHVSVQRKQKKTLLEGIHLCDTYLKQVGVPPLCVVSELAMTDPEVSNLVRQCQTQQGSCVMVRDTLARGLSATEHGTHIFFLVSIPDPVLPKMLSRTAVVLDRVQDPGNVGSVLRSAAAAGIEYIFCGSGTASCWSSKVVRSGMGAHFSLQLFEQVDLMQLLSMSQIPVLATSSYATQSIYEVDLNRPVVWLFGHEGQGVSADLMAQATDQVCIPHVGQVESLNIAASAAICFFEQVRQNKFD